MFHQSVYLIVLFVWLYFAQRAEVKVFVVAPPERGGGNASLVVSSEAVGKTMLALRLRNLIHLTGELITLEESTV